MLQELCTLAEERPEVTQPVADFSGEVVRVRAVVGDGFEKVVKLHRLAQERRESQALRLRFPVGKTREAHDRDVAKPRVGELQAPELFPAHSGHFEVEEDDAGRFTPQEKGESAIAAFRGDGAIALLLDHFPEDFEQVTVVVDDEHGGLHLDCLGGHWQKSYLSQRKVVSREGLEPST